MHWVFMFAAITAEVFATSLIKMTNEFTRLLPSLAVIIGYGVSFYCLSLALRAIPVGIAYAIWSGIGIVCVAIIGWIAYGQKLDLPAVIGLALILSGALVINLLSKSVTH